MKAITISLSDDKQHCINELSKEINNKKIKGIKNIFYTFIISILYIGYWNYNIFYK